MIAVHEDRLHRQAATSGRPLPPTGRNRRQAAAFRQAAPVEKPLREESR